MFYGVIGEIGMMTSHFGVMCEGTGTVDSA